VVHLLEVPGMFAFECHRHDRGAEQIIARTIGADADGLRSWLAGREIDEAEIWIDRRCLPNIGATLFPGVGFDGSKYPPAEPGALFLEPLKAAGGVADAAPCYGAT
jgi:hypothetical protein